MKKLLKGFSVAGLLLLSACAPVNDGIEAPDGNPPADQPAETTEVIKLGFIGPLTGDVASLGQDDKHAVEFFLEQNAMIAGKKVEVVYEDTQCNGEKSASAAQKLVNVDKVKLILGGGCSGETLAAAPIVEQNKVLLFSSMSTSPEVTKAGDFVFRNAPSDEKTTDVLADFIASKHKKVALISQNNDFAQAFRKKLQEKLPARSVEITVDEAFNTGTTDFKTILQKVKDSTAEAVVNLAGESAPAGFITKQARELAIQLPIFGTDVFSGSEYFDIAKDAAEGSIIAITSADKSRADVSKFLADFKNKFGENPSAEAYAILSYDRMNIIKMAIEAVGYDPEKIRDYLYQMAEYDGLAGKTKFDANGDSSILPNLMIAKGGKFEIWKP